MYAQITRTFTSPYGLYVKGEYVEIPVDAYDPELMTSTDIPAKWYAIYFSKGFQIIKDYLDEKGVYCHMVVNTIHGRTALLDYECAPKFYDEVVRPTLKELYSEWTLDDVVVECTRNDNMCVRAIALTGQAHNIPPTRLKKVLGIRFCML